MATIYRENCLDADNKPNDLSAKIAIHFRNNIKCPHTFKSDKNKGKTCNKNVFLCRYTGDYSCSNGRHFKKECYDEPYCKIIFKMIEEEQNKEKEAYEDEYYVDEYYVNFNMRMLKQELKKLDLEYDESIKPQARPNCSAPTGKTWSYYKGEWVEC